MSAVCVVPQMVALPALLLESKKGDRAAVVALLDAGADVNVVGVCGGGVALAVVSWQRAAWCGLFPRAVAPCRRGSTPSAGTLGSASSSRLLHPPTHPTPTHETPLPTTQPEGITPLILACALGHVDVAVTLVERGANVNMATVRAGVGPNKGYLQRTRARALCKCK
jgi:ankyrin repeat protein